MIRAKLREKFGKSETEATTEGGEPTPTEIPDETAADIQQDDEDESTSVLAYHTHSVLFYFFRSNALV
jgi:hypothetical protein